MRSPIIRRSSSICASPGPPRVADAAALTLEVAPAPDQPRRQVLQARELDLQLAFVALGARAEDLENQHRAIGDRDSEMALEVALLRRRQGLVEQHGLGLVHRDQLLQLVGLAGADEERRVGGLAARDDAGDRDVAGRLGQQRQLVERLVEMLLAAEVDADQDRPGGPWIGRRGVGSRRRQRAIRRARRFTAAGVTPARSARRPGSSPRDREPRSRSRACRPSG